MKRLFILSTSFFIFSVAPLMPAPTVTFFLRPYPFYDPKNPKLTYCEIHDFTTPACDVSGIFATYAGQLDSSNLNGQIEFNLKQVKPAFDLLITNKATPILTAHNTVHHWEIEQGTPAALYHIERKHDPDSKTHFWHITQKKLPETNIIPLETILIFAEPKDIFIPLATNQKESIIIADENINLTLPDIYVKQGIDKTGNALYVLNIKNFLAPVDLEYKKNGTHYATYIEEQ